MEVSENILKGSHWDGDDGSNMREGQRWLKMTLSNRMNDDTSL